MSSRKLVIDGTTYIRSRDAAHIVQLAPDYVSRLARGGLIEGRLVEKLWFVTLPSLEAFIADQERQKEIWRAELSRKRREEQILAGHPSALAA
jgi:hypothetical protein